MTKTDDSLLNMILTNCGVFVDVMTKSVVACDND